MEVERALGTLTYVYLWQIHFDIWQNQYNIVKLKNKIKLSKKKKKESIIVRKVISETVKNFKLIKKINYKRHIVYILLIFLNDFIN